MSKYSRRKRDRKFMAWIATLACLICGRRPVEVAHLGPHAFGQKCPDRQTGPLCIWHHREGPHSHHKLGKKFWEFWKIDREQIFSQQNAEYDRMVERKEAA